MKWWVFLGVGIFSTACSSPAAVTVSEWYVLEEIDGAPLPYGHGMSATSAGRVLFREDGTCVRQVTTIGSAAGPTVQDLEFGCRWSGGRGTVLIVWDDTNPLVPDGSTSAGVLDGDRLVLPMGPSDQVLWTEVYLARR